jgi:hypothetical protein
MKDVLSEIQVRRFGHFQKADPGCGRGVARLLGLEEELGASARKKTKGRWTHQSSLSGCVVLLN